MEQNSSLALKSLNKAKGPMAVATKLPYVNYGILKSRTPYEGRKLFPQFGAA